MPGEERATVHPYPHAKQIGTEGQGGPSIPEAILGAAIEVASSSPVVGMEINVGCARWGGPTPILKSRLDRIVVVFEWGPPPCRSISLSLG